MFVRLVAGLASLAKDYPRRANILVTDCLGRFGARPPRRGPV
jgi:hypothetical protein